jgi:hypothetical protein
MRLPNHIVLDFESNPKNNGNWYQEFISQKQSYNFVFDTFGIDKKFLPRKQKGSNLLIKQEKHTIKHSRSFQKYKLNKLNLTFNFDNQTRSSFYANTLKNLININFLRKERLYTKLKYSRSPAYDIVSGGAAALLAGFLGFLVSEKYGFELVDSGDFYYAFMYLVFLGFSIRPLLTSIDYNDSLRSIFSLKLFANFYMNLIYYFFKRR